MGLPQIELDADWATVERNRYSKPRIASFMSRTARSRPTIAARATIVWPILSSSIPSMQATG